MCMTSRSRGYDISSSFQPFPLIPSQRNFWKVLNEVDVEKLCMEAINEFLYNGKLYFFCLMVSNFLECVTNVDVLVELTLFIRTVGNL